MQTTKLIITGKVQGVFFRDNTRKNAIKIGLNGYVKNLPNGTVEIVAQGEKAQIEELRKWCNHGSPNSKVEKVSAYNINNSQSFKNFIIKH